MRFAYITDVTARGSTVPDLVVNSVFSAGLIEPGFRMANGSNCYRASPRDSSFGDLRLAKDSSLPVKGPRRGSRTTLLTL